MRSTSDLRLAVIGLGYVGLPLAVEFAKTRPVRRLRHQRAPHRRASQRRRHRPANVAGGAGLGRHLSFSTKAGDLAECNFFIVTVPTPVDDDKQPDLGPLLSASATIGKALKKGDIVVYESTVYPGATEEDCVPVLEKVSGLKFNQDFFVGYSPERINPGDKDRRVATIKKIISGSTPETPISSTRSTTRSSSPAPTAPSIKVAEAAKVIENTQRDLNIALINEFALIFSKLGIDTEEVLKAAGTKWNFLPFRPGLVGGHCIGVDPYYLAHKAQRWAIIPRSSSPGGGSTTAWARMSPARSSRRWSRSAFRWWARRVLVLGLAFKENCPDLRNTRIVDFVRELKDFGVNVDVCDPWVPPDDAMREYGIELVKAPEQNAYDAIIVAVAHDEFRKLGSAGIHALGRPSHVLYDLKYVLPYEESDLRL